MVHVNRSPDPHCAIEQAADVVGDWWSLLVVRDIARGYTRFEDLVSELGVSRKVLSQRLAVLTEREVLQRVPYQDAPPRHDYLLTEKGRALLAVVVALQDWGDRWLLGDGTVSATNAPDDATAHRVRDLIGSRVPAGLRLAATTGPGDVISLAHPATVLFSYPATGRPNPLPAGWGGVPGAAGCTMENRLFRDRADEFAAAGLAVHGVSTQRPEEQRAFAASESVTHPLLSDTDLQLASALRLPTLRVADQMRLRRAVLVVRQDGTVSAVRYPVRDIPDAVEWALHQA